jgi:arginine repressor
MDLEEFKKKHKTKYKSKLFNFKIEILELITDGYSQESICKFLKENGVQTNQPSVSRFISKLTNEQKIKKETFILKKENPETQEVVKEKPSETTQKKSLLKKSEIKNYEMVEPDYSKFQY